MSCERRNMSPTTSVIGATHFVGVVQGELLIVLVLLAPLHKERSSRSSKL